jgi:hypothetical protein
MILSCGNSSVFDLLPDLPQEEVVKVGIALGCIIEHPCEVLLLIDCFDALRCYCG